MLPRFFHRKTGSEASKRAFLPKSTDFGVLEGMLQDPCAAPMCLPMDFLKAITQDFSQEREVGRGGYGVVYKGILQNGKAIAVKKLSEMQLEDGPFQNEVIYLIGLKHKNIVKLVGYCAESRWEATQVSGKYVMAEIRKRLLCFEYLNKKSLDKHLSDESCGLKWNMRYQIIRGICSDFGMSRLFGQQQSRIITESRGGTRGYMAPEHLTNGFISTKSDIFSLGIIIIELMTGSRDYPPSSEASFERFIKNVVENWRNNLEKAPKYIPLEIESRQVNTCIVIGLNCVHSDPKKRPSALDILQMLNAVGSTNRHALVTEIDTLGYSVGMTNPITMLNRLNSSSLFSFSAKGSKISILALEVANTIVKSSSLMKILSKQSMEHLKEGVLRSEGVRRLISEDHNQLVVLVEADIRQMFRQFCSEVCRFGNMCVDPSWHNMFRCFDCLAGREMKTLKQMMNEESVSNIEYLTKLEKYTSELRGTLLVWDKCEKGLQYELCSGRSKRDQRNMLQTMRRSLKHQRSVAKNLGNKSLWPKTMEDIVAKLVDIVHVLNFEIRRAFLKNHGDQSVAPVTKLHQTLGPTGLALHYANVILQINTLVLASPAAVSYKARDALYQALPPCIKSKLRECCHRERTMNVAEVRAEMDRILQWLVPVAESTTSYYKNGAFGEWINMVMPEDIVVEEPYWPGEEERQTIAGASAIQRHVVNKIETLYHADKQKTEGYILDLIRGLHRLVC
ncbi:uncharacterized protein LOC8079731 isoform X2 [Sorghum bicolor]|uniref:uncharacterized protein LOC8079731 isoform X2 n=1 Tax=Sorghum bicolor TaxID=4558 RepID=UPI000B4236B8|nr:uncharacterized protein LOC8079731 isoform X2 [Sorghum bicolor]|eukprot:XP_021317102.1 uncharacterized protein LOC8079731 isoform X2 [Sorghum bicolor]